MVRFLSGIRFSLLRSDQTYSGAQPVSYRGRGVKLTIHLHLEPRLRMVELYLHYPMHLPGVVLN
jgi:hypothetical protein